MPFSHIALHHRLGRSLRPTSGIYTGGIQRGMGMLHRVVVLRGRRAKGKNVAVLLVQRCHRARCTTWYVEYCRICLPSTLNSTPNPSHCACACSARPGMGSHILFPTSRHPKPPQQPYPFAPLAAFTLGRMRGSIAAAFKQLGPWPTKKLAQYAETTEAPAF